MRRLLAVLVLAAAVASVATAVPTAAGAQTDEPVSTTSSPEPGGDIIPKPNSGAAPEDAGERGGALQTVLFVGVMGGIVVMGLLVVRQSRRARAERGF